VITAAAQAWDRYAGNATPRRPVNAAGASTWFNWTQYPDHGPDESVLGRVRGRRVLELGSGAGANLAHLATLGACCTGVDLAPSRAVAAQRTWSHLPDLDFVTADAVDYLATTATSFDVIYSIFGAVWFTEPTVLLPLVRQRVAQDGIFAFSHLPPSGSASKPGQLIKKWELAAEDWVRLLAEVGFDPVTATMVPPPAPDRSGTLLVRAGRGG
jgi:SAM-dependent methyltransferase